MERFESVQAILTAVADTTGLREFERATGRTVQQVQAQLRELDRGLQQLGSGRALQGQVQQLAELGQRMREINSLSGDQGAVFATRVVGVIDSATRAYENLAIARVQKLERVVERIERSGAQITSFDPGAGVLPTSISTALPARSIGGPAALQEFRRAQEEARQLERESAKAQEALSAPRAQFGKVYSTWIREFREQMATQLEQLGQEGWGDLAARVRYNSNRDKRVREAILDNYVPASLVREVFPASGSQGGSRTWGTDALTARGIDPTAARRSGFDLRDVGITGARKWMESGPIGDLLAAEAAARARVAELEKRIGQPYAMGAPGRPLIGPGSGKELVLRPGSQVLPFGYDASALESLRARMFGDNIARSLFPGQAALPPGTGQNRLYFGDDLRRAQSQAEALNRLLEGSTGGVKAFAQEIGAARPPRPFNEADTRRRLEQEIFGPNAYAARIYASGKSRGLPDSTLVEAIQGAQGGRSREIEQLIPRLVSGYLELERRVREEATAHEEVVRAASAAQAALIRLAAEARVLPPGVVTQLPPARQALMPRDMPGAPALYGAPYTGPYGTPFGTNGPTINLGQAMPGGGYRIWTGTPPPWTRYPGGGGPGGLPPGSGGGGGGIPPFGGGIPPFGGGPAGGGGPFIPYNTGGSRGFISDFETGFRGRRGLPFAEQFGQAAKFSVLYGAAYSALFQITQAFQTGLQEAIEFQKGLVELNIATGQAGEANRELARQLGDTAASAGFAPSQGVLTGARGIGLFGLTEADPGVQAAAARINARVVSQSAFISGRTPEQLQQDIGATAQAFGTGYQGLSRIQDLDAFLTRRYGVVPGSTFQTTAQIGSIGVAAGFSPEEITALAAKLQQRTGQTPAAVAGLLSQFFGRSGDPALADKFGALGIDTTGDFRSQIQALSQQELSASQNALIVNAFGRGRSGQAASIIIDDFGQITADAKLAQTESAGAGQRAFDERIKTVGGQLAQLGGTVKNLAKEVAESGFLDALGLGAVAVNTFAGGLLGTIRLFNEIPRPLRAAALGLGALATAALVAARFGGATGIRGGLGVIGSNLIGFGGRNPAAYQVDYLPPARRGAGLEQGFFQYAAARNAGGSFGSALGAAGGARFAGAVGLAAIGGPVGAAVIGVSALAVAAGQAKQALDEFKATSEDAKEGLSGLDEVKTADDFRNRANLLRGLATSSYKQNDNPFDALILAGAPDTLGNRLSYTADFLEKQAKIREDLLSRRASELNTGVFGDDPEFRTVDSFSKGLEALESEGASAADRFDVLTQAIRETGQAASDTALKFKIDREALATGAVSNILGQDFFTGGTPKPREDEFLKDRSFGAVFKDLFFGSKTTLSPAPNQGYAAAVASSASDIQLAVQEALPNRAEGGLLTDEQINLAASAAVGALGLDAPADLRDQVREKVTAYLTEQRELRKKAQGNGPLSGKDLNDIITQQFLPTLDESIDQLGPRADNTSRTALLKSGVAEFASYIERAGGDVPTNVLAEYNILRQRYAQSAIEDLNRLRRARQSQGKINQTGLLKRAVNIAVENNDDSSLAELILAGGTLAKNYARVALNNALKVVKAAQTSLAITNPELAGRSPQAAAQRAEISRLEGELRALDSYEVGEENVWATGSDVGSSGSKETAAQKAAARRLAEARRRGGAIGIARATVDQAAADLAAAEKGTVAYYNALAAWYEAKDGLTEAIQEYQNNQELLGIDLTDPVAEATAALNAARRKLRSDQRRGKSPEVIAADRLEVRRAEIARENARFSQWLRDLQTNEQLKRITHAQYISALEAEIARIKRVKNRTRQQQDALNELELALQAAREQFQGQFNLGDIKIPAPYEVRRSIAAQNASYQAQTTTTTNISINGADTGQVEAILVRILGPTASGRSTTTVRRT